MSIVIVIAGPAGPIARRVDRPDRERERPSARAADGATVKSPGGRRGRAEDRAAGPRSWIVADASDRPVNRGLTTFVIPSPRVPESSAAGAARATWRGRGGRVDGQRDRQDRPGPTLPAASMARAERATAPSGRGAVGVIVNPPGPSAVVVPAGLPRLVR